MHLRQGRLVGDRYEIMDQIGSGGMAIVYRAKDLKLARFVTIKVMREEFVLDEEFIGRFNVEAKSAANLTNQYIVNVYDVGQEGNIHYIVMEYIDGFTLKELIKRRAPFGNDETLGVAIQIAYALSIAHANKVIHRDIKPQNILVTANGIVKVTDFGIARAVSSSTVTTAGNAMGSVHYFSPEQARGGYVDYKSDIYSLGIVMFEMATGRLPFDGETTVTVALKQINDPLPDMREFNPDISETVEQIILKASDKHSANRYQTIDEMCNELKRALTNTTGQFSRTDTSVENSPTIKITAEDVAAIKREARSVFFAERDEDDYDEEDDYYEDEDDYEEAVPKNNNNSSDRKIIIAGILTAIAIIAIIITIAISYLTNQKILNSEIAIPPLAGMDYEEAQTILDELGVLLVPEDQRTDDTVEKGSIIERTNEGVKIKKGDRVTVITSLGSEKVKVPNVVKKDINEVYKSNVFEDTRLEFKERYINDDDTPINVVIRQEPEGDQEVTPDTVVILYVSQGQKMSTVTVPEVVGKTEADAIALCQERGLVVGRSSMAESTTVAEGRVIRQTLAQGKEVGKGSTISFVISSGLPKATPAPTQAVTTKTKTLTVDITPSTLPEGTETVKLRVLRSTSTNTVEEFVKDVKVADLPMDFKFTGTGDATFIVYVIDDSGQQHLLGEKPINFDE